MSDHVVAWLGRDLDDELHGMHLRKVEAHLEECADCRRELAQLISLSSLLQEYPAFVPTTSPARFRAQVALKLPARDKSLNWGALLRWCWLAIPPLLLLAIAFAQGFFLLVQGSLFLYKLGLNSDLVVRLAPELSALLSFVNDRWSDLDNLLYTSGSLFLFQATLLLIVGVLACSWVASWWVSQQQGVLQKGRF